MFGKIPATDPRFVPADVTTSNRPFGDGGHGVNKPLTRLHYGFICTGVSPANVEGERRRQKQIISIWYMCNNESAFPDVSD